MTSRASNAWAVIALVVVCATSCAPYSQMGGTTYLGFSVGISNAPPPPVLVLAGPSSFTVALEQGVYTAADPGADCDVFMYSSQYYMYYSGYWYVSVRSEGPYRAIDVHRVPRPVLNVPPGHWRHHPMAHREGRDRDPGYGDHHHD